MKKTAIEWFIEQLENHNGVTKAGFEKCVQQAKEMERIQICDAYVYGSAYGIDVEKGFHPNNYFDNTFKSE